MSLANRVAIITGASRGIGRTLALALARRGVNIVVASKSVKDTPELPGTIYSVAKEIEDTPGDAKALPIQVDVREESSISHMVDETVRQFGKVDILVNNAGALHWKSIDETPAKKFDLMHSINSRATFLASRECLPHMRKNGWGHVIMQSPPITLNDFKNKTGYLMSKYGMSMVAKGIAHENTDFNIAANAVWPVTLIESAATINHKIGDRKLWRTPDILCDAIIAILEKEPKTFTGHTLYDEEILRQEGVTDFSKYQCVPGFEPPSIEQLQSRFTG
eukprot:m.282378 g.282378  ORF g.282378 m.282378 type:complete len:277 (+) comp122290_c0_seq1:13-843(+)